ncbi:MAG: PIG-L family deacetylase [Pirellulales bacterium]|nr:PIG-L family deacetylase [Pirellulales bacterium]
MNDKHDMHSPAHGETAPDRARDVKRRILAIHAHPDDVEFQCAGTLALLAAAGHTVIIATMTPGDCGSREMGPEEIAAVRREEARRAAEIIGAEYHCLEFRDLSIVIDNDSKRRVTELVRRARPDVVLTAPPVDYMEDHEATSKLVRDACFNASCPNYATRQWEPAPPTDRIPALFYVDPVEGKDLWGEPILPHFYIDVSDVFETKQQMLACHESQRNWLRAQHGVDEYLESQRRWGAGRGWEVGVKFAEAYRQHVGHPYPSHNSLVDLLPGRYYTRS